MSGSQFRPVRVFQFGEGGGDTERVGGDRFERRNIAISRFGLGGNRLTEGNGGRAGSCLGRSFRAQRYFIEQGVFDTLVVGDLLEVSDFGDMLEFLQIFKRHAQ